MADEIGTLFGAVKSLLNFTIKPVKIENTVFSLFSRVTVAILFLSAGLVTLTSWLGEPIQCITTPEDNIIQQKVLNQYCWIMSTYTLPYMYGKGSRTIAPGVGPGNSKDEKMYHSYYQWVPFVLFAQGMLFLIPHILWKAWEDGRIKAYSYLELTSETKESSSSIELNGRALEINDEQAQKSLRQGAEYFKSCMDYEFNYFYSGFYVFCEILNFIIVIGTIFLTDAFLGNEFTSYGVEVLGFVNSLENRVDPMDRVFPKSSKCDFPWFGPSRSIIHYDFLCVLGLNSLNEKIYVFLWFWFVVLAIVGGLNLIYRLLVVLSPRLRERLILRSIQKIQRDNYSGFVSRLGYSDWFLLRKISNNITSRRFRELCMEINAALGGDESDGLNL